MINDYEAKLAFEKKLLIGVLIAGIPLLAGAFWYRNDQIAKYQAQQKIRLADSVYNEQTVPYTLTIATGSKGPGMIAGRAFENKMDQGADYTTAKSDANRLALAGLVNGEALWPTPLSETGDMSKAKAPFNFTWLIYSEKEALSVALDQVRQAAGATKFEFDGWTKDSLTKGQSDLYYLKGQLNLSVNGSLDASLIKWTGDTGAIATSTLATSTEPVSSVAAASVPAGLATVTTDVKSTPVAADNTKPVVTPPTKPSANLAVGATMTVAQTETGWLNVRQTPATTGALIIKVNPGEQYKVLAIQKDWAQIELKDGSSGWVAARYLQ